MDVAFLRLGQMGAGMAGNLLAAATSSPPEPGTGQGRTVGRLKCEGRRRPHGGPPPGLEPSWRC